MENTVAEVTLVAVSIPGMMRDLVLDIARPTD